MSFYVFFFFKQKTAYDMRISDWSSDVCSSDLRVALAFIVPASPAIDVECPLAVIDPAALKFIGPGQLPYRLGTGRRRRSRRSGARRIASALARKSVV